MFYYVWGTSRSALSLDSYKPVIDFVVMFGNASGAEIKSSALHENEYLHCIDKMQTVKYASSLQAINKFSVDETNIVCNLILQNPLRRH